MSFRTNLQYLRTRRNLTQERLAMLLGVSRQAVSKWESEKAYPEMDKLLMICDLFGCTLDDLVMGDVSRPSGASTAASGTSGRDAGADATAGESGGGSPDDADAANDDADDPTIVGPATPAIPFGSPAAQDVTGYDEHRRSFAMRLAVGVGAIIAGTAAAALFDDTASILGDSPLNDLLTFACIAVGVVAGLALIVPACMGHAAFRRAHPYVEDFYTMRDHETGARRLAVAVVAGIAAIMTGVGVTTWADGMLGQDDGWPAAVMLLACAIGVTLFVWGGVLHAMLDIGGYNREAEKEAHEREGRADFYDVLTGAVCGVIMLVATIAGLWLLFTGAIGADGRMDWDAAGDTAATNLFWLPWPIGGLLCGIAVLIIQVVRRRGDR
ncbi:helix-turn-helix transcriptional regulator [Bifidobacterium samirii]|uniref:XRE family transcriptional regulator n=1 Tax=Bifidobacterium samirii TaxID=2306974 RepID=A0A430FW88_9BIFI|nr:helix-turn-helix transcriptional regulator [Bifidobacterium samirii]RSX58377.1 XRE family transcriptional regulator [Bifidobacterium samirii]